MTLILVSKSENDICVVADTMFRGAGRSALEAGPKIFPVPVRIERFGGSERVSCLDAGFAFAGHSAAGQVTHALAGASLLSLIGPTGSTCPSVQDVARFYARCAVAVVEEMRRHKPTDRFLFEGVIFGWAGDVGRAYSFEVLIDSEGQAVSEAVELDFKKFGMFAFGQGSAEVQAFLDRERGDGPLPTIYDVLTAVIDDDALPGVGGTMQAAIASHLGVELKPIVWLGPDNIGKAVKFMGFDLAALGVIGDLIPINMRPVILTDPAPKA